MPLDFSHVLANAGEHEAAMSSFLRDMIRIPSVSGNEREVVERVRTEMKAVGFDRIEIDRMGNILGYIGTGSRLIAMDAHLDTVTPGNEDNWSFDPYQGREDDTAIYGLGSSDQLSGMASMVYAGKIIKDLGLDGDYTLLVTGTVQEEDCDGLCWRYLIEEGGIRPEFVVCTEPSDDSIRLGQKGRMEIKVSVQGKSAHASTPDQGVNAIFSMAHILTELQELGTRLKEDTVLGKGTLTVSEIFHTSPSRCAVADGCWISVDRRLTAGETVESALEEIRSLPAAIKANATVELYEFDEPSYTGLVYPAECSFPSWKLKQDHLVCGALVKAYCGLFGTNPELDTWAFSTNGTAIMGQHGIPCIGYGPGLIDQAHKPDEKVLKNKMVKAAAMYAVIPLAYLEHEKTAD